MGLLNIIVPLLLLSTVEGKLILVNETDSSALVHISTGFIQGRLISSYDGREGYGFMAVPFAQPPVGSLRFHKPLPAEKWKGIRDAREKRGACPAIMRLTYKTGTRTGPMSEDCLHNYVYTSRACLTKGGCPVVFVVHGGRFNFESPVSFNDSVIVHNFASEGQDVVVVATAYRLNIFGFINLHQDASTDANSDILLSLKWVHREIGHFGGDSKRITIFGHSAGAMLTDQISVSPAFDGLFNQMVCMSGARTTWHTSREVNRAASWKHAELVGCVDASVDRANPSTVQAVVECLRAKPWKEIFPRSIRDLGASRKPFPILLGTTTKEFMSTRAALNVTTGRPVRWMVEELCEVAAYTTEYEYPERVRDACIEHYMKGDNIKDYMQDLGFQLPIYRVARIMADKGAEVYLYSFNHFVGSAFNNIMHLADEDRPGHAEDFIYIFGLHRENFTEKDYRIEKIYSSMFLTFIKTGRPEPGDGQKPWPKFTHFSNAYYDIDFPDESLKMPGPKKFFHRDAMKLWHETAPRVGERFLNPLSYPEHFDKFDPTEISDAYGTSYNGKRYAHDKTNVTCLLTYQRWLNFTRAKRKAHLGSRRQLRVADFSMTGATGSSSFIVLIVFLMFGYTLVVLAVKFEWTGEKRKGYEAL